MRKVAPTTKLDQRAAAARMKDFGSPVMIVSLVGSAPFEAGEMAQPRAGRGTAPKLDLV